MTDYHYQRYYNMIASDVKWADEDVATLTRIITTSHWLTAKQKTMLLERLAHINQLTKLTPALNLESV